MTIDGLNALTALTAGDELPVWDVEASGEEPTKKITAQNMANSVKTLANLQGTLTFDTTPTTGSTNPVTSGGVADAITQSTASDWRSLTSYLSSIQSGANATITYAGKMRTITFQGVSRVNAENDILMTLPQEHRPLVQTNNYFIGNIGGTSVVIAINGSTGNVVLYTLNGATSTARIYFSATYMVQ